MDFTTMKKLLDFFFKHFLWKIKNTLKSKTFRKNSFIIIDMKELSDIEIKQRMQVAIRTINRYETFFMWIFNNYYLIMTMLFSFFRIQHRIIAKVMFIRTDENKNLLLGRSIDVYIMDNGIQIKNFLIPYENIITFGMRNQMGYFEVFCSIEREEGENFKIELSSEILIIVFSCDTNFIEIVRKNMFYHIKYHKVNTDILNFYKRKTE